MSVAHVATLEVLGRSRSTVMGHPGCRAEPAPAEEMACRRGGLGSGVCRVPVGKAGNQAGEKRAEGREGER